MFWKCWKIFGQHLVNTCWLITHWILWIPKKHHFYCILKVFQKVFVNNCHFNIVKWIMTKDWRCICLSQNKFWDIAWLATINELSEFFSTQKWFRKITISCVLGGKQNNFWTIQDIQWLSNSIYNNEVVEISGVYFHMRWVYGNM